MERMPTYETLLWPTLKILESSGGSASIQEILKQLSIYLNLPDSIMKTPHGEGPQSEVAYRAAWARTHLKLVGSVTNSERGVWTVSKAGREINSEQDIKDLIRQMRTDKYKARQRSSNPDDVEHGDLESDAYNWKERLLAVIRKIEPDAFERLCQRVLREAGFVMVEVTGRSGDGGIDGAGVLRVNLLSFHVRFQCKRYKGTVGAGQIRDFRGGLIGRADKGLFITTGSFTTAAEQEAVRDGATAIDLVDGDQLCDLLKRYGLGTSTETVERVNVVESFFEDL